MEVLTGLIFIESFSLLIHLLKTYNMFPLNGKAFIQENFNVTFLDFLLIENLSKVP